MRLLLFLLLVSFSLLKAQSIITGVVSLNGDLAPGCTVTIIQNNTTQFTDIDGCFAMSAGDLKNLSVVISFSSITCKVVIDEIPVGISRIELDTIPLFYNEEAGVAEYNKFSSDEKKKYLPTYCWDQLIGYVNTTKCNTTQVWNMIRVKKGIKYRFDSLDNKAVIHYKDWKR